jgi:hypothetical protein
LIVFQGLFSEFDCCFESGMFAPVGVSILFYYLLSHMFLFLASGQIVERRYICSARNCLFALLVFICLTFLFFSPSVVLVCQSALKLCQIVGISNGLLWWPSDGSLLWRLLIVFQALIVDCV